jgi:hypothetical protein
LFLVFGGFLLLATGQVLTFNNRRMLHGREAFAHGGARHLQGVYVNIDEFKSKHRVLAASFGGQTGPLPPPRHVGNQDVFAS